MELKAPFPWFGGKSRVAHLVWERFGNVKNYVEPFYGSGAVLLGRPNYDRAIHTETVNDLDCYVANFWRALQNDPDGVAYWCDSPVNEADLSARHQWLVNQVDFRESMKTDPDFYNVKIAGWWVWGLCSWIGTGWCAIRESDSVHRKLPHLGDAGRGVNRQLPHLGDAGRGDLQGYLEALSARLRRVRVACGDWSRVLGESPTEKLGITGIFLDPPYDRAIRCKDVYSSESDVSRQVREWAIAHGNNPKLRTALCGYEGEHDMPPDWECVQWKAAGGFASQRRDKSNENGAKERIWFSPYCIQRHAILDRRGQFSLALEGTIA